MASAHEVKNLDTSPRWDNRGKGRVHKPHSAWPECLSHKSYIHAGNACKGPELGWKNTAFHYLLTRNIDAFGSSQLRSGAAVGRDGKLSSMKSLFRMSGWLKKPLWPNQLKTKQIKTIPQFPSVNPLYGHQTRICPDAYLETHIFRPMSIQTHNPLDCAQISHVHTLLGRHSFKCMDH